MKRLIAILFLALLAILVATAAISQERAPVVLRGRDVVQPFQGPMCSPALEPGTPCVWQPIYPCTITTNAGTPCLFSTPLAQDHNQCVETWVVRYDDTGGVVLDARRIRVCVDSGELAGYRGFGWDVFLVVSDDGSAACGPAGDAGYFGSGNVQVECPQ